jgi:hypothetical protein
MRVKEEPRYVCLSVAGIQELRLIATDAGNGNNSDHVNLCNLRLSTAEDAPPPDGPPGAQAVFQAIPTRPTSSPGRPERGSTAPGEGEIRLTGTVKSLRLAQQELVIEASSFALPNGQVELITPPKPKIVTLGAETLARKGQVAEGTLLTTLREGQKVIAVGRDLGSGKPLPACLVVIIE